MRKGLLVLALTLVVSAVGGLALANHEDTSGYTHCGWTGSGGNTSTGSIAGLKVYEGPNSSQTTENGGTAVGVCSDGTVPVHGVAEAKVGGSCSYVVADGDRHNPPDPDAIDGYAKVSTGGACGPNALPGASGSHHG